MGCGSGFFVADWAPHSSYQSMKHMHVCILRVNAVLFYGKRSVHMHVIAVVICDVCSASRST